MIFTFTACNLACFRRKAQLTDTNTCKLGVKMLLVSFFIKKLTSQTRKYVSPSKGTALADQVDEITQWCVLLKTSVLYCTRDPSHIAVEIAVA